MIDLTCSIFTAVFCLVFMQRNRFFRVSSKSFHQVGDELLRSWWVISFAGFCLCLHLIAERSHFHQLNQLRMLRTQRLRQRTYWNRQVHLWSMRQLNSENPQWVELVLRRELGVCPTRTIKAVFQREPLYSAFEGDFSPQ